MRGRFWLCCAIVGLGMLNPPRVHADEACAFTCGDLNGDQAVDLADFGLLSACLEQSPALPPECICADLDGSSLVDLRDFAILTLVFAKSSDELPPNCTGAPAASANLTAYRPQHGAAYFPFAKTAVAEADESSPTLGPGIRINSPGDADPQGEDDLVEVQLVVAPPGASMALRRGDAALHVWTTRAKQPGTEIAFNGDRTDALPIGPSDTALTLWVEWAAPTHGTAELRAEPAGAAITKDSVLFHTFHSIVIALGGESQVPSNPVDPNHGTFVAAIALYGQGYDVHMFDEDVVSADGAGEGYNVTADAIQHRLVDEVAIFGYSHGGGSAHDLADRLDTHRAALGLFDITYTSYVDSVSNSSDTDISQELRRPPSAVYHLNQYQHGSFFEDLGLDGGPVPNSNPPPTGLDVETTPWGAHATHFQIDDFVDVRDLIDATLTPQVTR